MGSQTQLQTAIRMNGGHGVHSYSRNSSVIQKRGIVRVKSILEESICTMNIMGQLKTLCIADLGCSCGPNTLLAIQNIVEAVEKKCGSDDIAIPEMQVFFNDLPSTDFNTIFRDLPPLVNHPADALTRRSYFAAGVPGSFHDQVFPTNSLHFVHSSYAVHWLSQVPVEIEDKNGEAFNKGRICISKGVPRSVEEAYLGQFRKDFSAFLRARAKELGVGARMFLLIPSRSSNSDPSTNPGYFTLLVEALGHALNDLASQGIVDEGKVDSFNLPLYFPSPQEVTSEVDAEGSFKILQVEFLKRRPDINGEVEEYAKMHASALRAGLESIIEFHFDFGGEVMDKLFERHAHIFANAITENIEEKYGDGDLVLVVEKKQT